MISPKQQFLTVHKKDAEALAQMSQQSALTVGITYALAELGCHGISQDKMAGARLGFEVLLNLPHPGVELPKLPVKQLAEGPTPESPAADPKKK